MRTLRVYILDESRRCSPGPRHEVSAARTRCPGRSKTSSGSQAIIYSALPIVPGRRVRGEGAAPTVRWCCPRTRSMARLQRLQLSAAVSSVKNGAAICQTGRQPVPHRRRSALTAVLRETRGVTRTTRRARSSLASETHTKRNAPRRRLAPKVTHTSHRLPRRLPRLRQGPKRHD